MALTINQFCAAVASDKRKPPKLCGHKGCTKPLGPRFGDTIRSATSPSVKTVIFGELADELEKFPIGRLGVRRR